MGAMQNNERGKKKSGRARGSVKNADRLDAFSKGAAESAADWGGCDSKWVQAVVVGITELGGAVTFGLSRNKGAHSVTLLLDDSRETLWFNGDAELDEALQGVVAVLDAME